MAVDNTARGLAIKAPPHPGYVAGNWYSPPLTGAVGAGAALASGSVKLMPFYLSKPIIVSDLGCRITTLSGGGNVRLAIYRTDATKKPTGTALVETGNISTAATGALSAAVTAQQMLSPGLYYMAVNADNATVVLQILTNTTNAPTVIVGSTTLANVTSAGTAANIAYSFASAFGAFPDLTGQALTENAPSSAWGLVYMKAA